MTQGHIFRMLLVAALFACSACTGKTTTASTTFVTPASQQLTVIKWEEATAASTAARVNNTSLIFMR